LKTKRENFSTRGRAFWSTQKERTEKNTTSTPLPPLFRNLIKLEEERGFSDEGDDDHQEETLEQQQQQEQDEDEE
jgi:hypothetical protein